MPRESKCGYCRKEGHNISKCDSERGNTLFNNIRSRAIDHIMLERRSIHERATLFYDFLMNICFVDELKIILTKYGCIINGNKKQLAARFVYSYFIRELADGPFARYIEYHESLYLSTYAEYWGKISLGKPLNEANEELNKFYNLTNYKLHYNKFPINVVIKTFDLTEEDPQLYFECAICMEENCLIVDQVKLGCNHSFCESCIDVVLTNSKNNKKKPCCALCRADFKTLQVHKYKTMEEYNNKYCYSC
jgi:hypothetical protein